VADLLEDGRFEFIIDGLSLPVSDRRHYDGIGFVPTRETGLVLIDLDKCVDENGTISDDARTDLDSLCSYSEKSPSGTGIRCIIK
jgi:primase-polymerase (primpol)-like protein